MSIANAEQYDAWNGDSGRRWIADPDRRDRVIAPVAGALFDAARLAPGERVLDVGCGCGATTLAAARAIAPGGDVVGIDLSGPMLAVARRRAETDAVANAAFLQADAQTHAVDDAGFDVAISRFRDDVLRRSGRGVRQHRPSRATGRAAVHRHLAAAARQ
jgi:2-polyprenyl-3-methyl-5-hydroxy-6-metoxy-1,4-benzoquinol methylase